MGENWAPIVHRKQRGDWPGAVCGSQRAPPQGEWAGTGWPGADPGSLFTAHKPESWHHDLKTFILDKVDGEGREQRIVFGLGREAAQRVTRVPGLLSCLSVRPWASQETSNVWSIKRGAGCLLPSLWWSRHQHPKGKMLWKL